MKKFLALLSVCVAFPLSRAAAYIGEIDVNSGPPADHASNASQDRSALWLKSGTRVTVLVVDPQGHRTGVDAKTFQVVQEIPDSNCDVDFMENQYTGEQHAEADERVTLDPAKKGVYKLWVHGLQAGPFEISISALSKNGSSEPSKDVEGLISEGENRLLRLTFDPAPNSALSVVDTSHS